MLGNLFSSKNNDKQKDNLIVFLTPHIVRNKTELRSLALTECLPLLQRNDCEFICLQSGDCSAEIAAAKSSVIVAGGALAGVTGRLTAAVSGSPVVGCQSSGLTNETIVPRATPCTAGVDGL